MTRRLSIPAMWALALLLSACSNHPQPEPVPVIPPAFPTDSQMKELQARIVELTDRLDVMNSRMQMLEAGASSSHAAETRPPSTAQKAAVAPTSSSTAAATDRVRGANIADQYRKALTFYGQNRVDEARKLFLQILEADPSGDLADNALYWLGETHFAKADYSGAMSYYRKIVSEYPQQNKASDAMLKIGLAYVKLGDLALARTTFQQLVETYPYSTPAASARDELKRIKY